MNDEIVVEQGYTAREVDILARLYFDAWSVAGFDPDVTVARLLNGLVNRCPDVVPAYIVQRVIDVCG